VDTRKAPFIRALETVVCEDTIDRGFIKSYFDSFYNEEIITEESFNACESGAEEEQGKGVVIATSSVFFRWLGRGWGGLNNSSGS